MMPGGDAAGWRKIVAGLTAAEGTRGSEAAYPERWQDAAIAGLIPSGASVLDLGCGDGALLERLRDRHGCRVQGVERSAEAVFACVERGVPVIQADIDSGLIGFGDGLFDWVVLEETLQTLGNPGLVLTEMLRVGRAGIVSFPNFGYWQVRLDLLQRGRMPVTERLPQGWADTDNIHHLTLDDFRDWCDGHGVRLDGGWALADGAVRPLSDDDDLLAAEVLLIIRRG